MPIANWPQALNRFIIEFQDRIPLMYLLHQHIYTIFKTLQTLVLDCFYLKNFWAIQASFRFIMLAYNLMALFGHAALSDHSRATLKTVCLDCFALGLWVSSYTGKRVLKISLLKKKRTRIDSVFRNIEQAYPAFLFFNAESVVKNFLNNLFL